jgi:aminoglycoside phosphotransferase (APT) family kinase protein
MFAGTKEVGEHHRFDEKKLEAYLAERIEGFQRPLAVRQFRGGQSNPTYQLVTPNRKYVLRRKPPGKLLPSAHAVDREFRAISALHPTGFPVAKPFLLCEDESIAGTMFYVMECVEGRVIWESTIPGADRKERRAIYDAMNETIARLHNLDYEKIGLGDFGKPGAYVARQISRWTKQYQLSETETIEEMNKLIEWLPAHLPAEGKPSVVHGDYRLDNMILHPTETLVNSNLEELGIPTLDEYVQMYLRRTGRTESPDMNYYAAYNFFRLGGILQGIVGRVRDGTAASANATQNASAVRPLAQRAWYFAKRAGAKD